MNMFEVPDLTQNLSNNQKFINGKFTREIEDVFTHAEYFIMITNYCKHKYRTHSNNKCLLKYFQELLFLSFKFYML